MQHGAFGCACLRVDPVTQFLEYLFVHYDFDSAQQQLKECEQVGLFAVVQEEFIEDAHACLVTL
jgi:hypothetical protein